ncbi:MAG: hypothetical protein WKH64_17205 [Chloroflexia bacterium]
MTARPGVLGEARTYVGSEQAGVALHKRGEATPTSTKATAHECAGSSTSTTGNQAPAGAVETQRLGPGELVSPTLIRTGAVGFLTEGRLVRVGATITRRSGRHRRWTMVQARLVRILESTGIPRRAGSKGDPVEAAGIVSGWDGRWRVLPRDASDLRIVELPKGAPRAGGGWRVRYITECNDDLLSGIRGKCSPSSR